MKKNSIFLLLIMLAISFSIISCKNDGTDNNKTSDQSSVKVTPVEKVKIPKFNRDTAYNYIVEQMNYGPRVPGSEAHSLVKDYLEKELSRFMDKTSIQEFSATLHTGEKHTGYNIIGNYNPELDQRIMLAAHWDSRLVADHDPDESNREKHVPGANDGASGVAVLLEIARLLKENPIDLGVDIVFFDLEDQGADGGSAPNSWCLGSQYFANNLPIASSRYQNGILLDMVGAKGAQFPKEAVSQRYARTFHNKVWALADAMGYGNLFVDKLVGGVTDDHLYINQIAGIPMIDIIDKRNTQNGFFPHWHTVSDGLENIDKGTLRGVGQVTTAVIYKTYNQDF